MMNISFCIFYVLGGFVFALGFIGYSIWHETLVTEDKGLFAIGTLFYMAVWPVALFGVVLIIIFNGLVKSIEPVINRIKDANH